MPVSVRPAAPTDASEILRLIGELAAFEGCPNGSIASIKQLESALFGSNPIAEALIAEVGGETVGVAVFFANFSTWTGKRGLYLEDLYITPAARRLGAGTALLNRLAGIAIERNYGRFEWSVLDWNEPAIQFYVSLGARAMNDWRVYRISGEALNRLAAA